MKVLGAEAPADLPALRVQWGPFLGSDDLQEAAHPERVVRRGESTFNWISEFLQYEPLVSWTPRDEAKYVLLMLDIDARDPRDPRKGPHMHWMVANAHNSSENAPSVVYEYHGPAFTKHGYTEMPSGRRLVRVHRAKQFHKHVHRFVVAAYEQVDGLLALPSVGSRKEWDVRGFLASNRQSDGTSNLKLVGWSSFSTRPTRRQDHEPPEPVDPAAEEGAESATTTPVEKEEL